MSEPREYIVSYENFSVGYEVYCFAIIGSKSTINENELKEWKMPERLISKEDYYKLKKTNESLIEDLNRGVREHNEMVEYYCKEIRIVERSRDYAIMDHVRLQKRINELENENRKLNFYKTNADKTMANLIKKE